MTLTFITAWILILLGMAYFDGTGVASVTPASAPVGVQPPSCARRVFLPTIDARLFALDAQSVEPCVDLGDKGVVDLRAGMPNLNPGANMQTSPPVVAGGVVIVAGAINDNASARNPSGVIRAYNLTTGRKLWQSRLPAGGQATPMTYRIDGRQMVVVAAGAMVRSAPRWATRSWHTNRSEVS